MVGQPSPRKHEAVTRAWFVKGSTWGLSADGHTGRLVRGGVRGVQPLSHNSCPVGGSDTVTHPTLALPQVSAGT